MRHPSTVWRKPAAPEHGTGIHTILAVTDLSPQENTAVDRAAQLAPTHGATVKLMYWPASAPATESGALGRLAQAARRLEERLGLGVSPVPVIATRPDELVQAAQSSDLVVLPHRRERSTAAFFRGQPVLQLVRRSRVPLLVARQSDPSAYERLLVAVDFSQGSEALVKLAAELDPHAELELFHAISTLDEAKLRSAEATQEAIRRYRDRCLSRARERMLTLTDTFVARRNRFLATIGRGDAGRQAVIQQEHSGADLVVLGKRHASAWEDFFCGSVAHQVLSWGRSDVLIVPLGSPKAAVSVPASAQAARPAAARRPLRPAA